MNFLLAAYLLLSPCGGSQTVAPSAANLGANGGYTKRSGRIYLRNETPYAIEVAYLY